MQKQTESNPAPSERVSALISHLMTAISGCSLYSVRHPVVREFCAAALDLLPDLYVGDAIDLSVIGDSIIFNNIPIVEKGRHIDNFIRRLKRKKIDRISIKKAPDLDELMGFISSMSSKDRVPSTAHISAGTVEVRLKASGPGATELLDRGVSRVRESLQGVSRFRELDMVGLEDAVLDFIGVLKKELGVLNMISPVKAHNEYTYVHASNVSVLSIFQAEALGFTGECLRDIGLAGLLHDVGKMFVPNAVLDKQSGLDRDEWDEMKKHPVYGAMYLSKLPETPPLAAVVAFEHHMKFDGTGYPDTRRSGRDQHIASQIVAVSDFFDALRTERPYRKPLQIGQIARLLKEGAGRDFNPRLVDNFLRSLGGIRTIPEEA